jgi:hypothetical protein
MVKKEWSNALDKEWFSLDEDGDFSSMSGNLLDIEEVLFLLNSNTELSIRNADKLKKSQEMNREAVRVIEYYSEGMAHCDYDHYNLNMKDGHITVASGKRARKFRAKYENEIEKIMEKEC